jgi:hypothetical protein
MTKAKRRVARDNRIKIKENLLENLIAGTLEDQENPTSVGDELAEQARDLVRKQERNPSHEPTSSGLPRFSRRIQTSHKTPSAETWESTPGNAEISESEIRRRKKDVYVSFFTLIFVEDMNRTYPEELGNRFEVIPGTDSWLRLKKIMMDSAPGVVAAAADGWIKMAREALRYREIDRPVEHFLAVCESVIEEVKADVPKEHYYPEYWYSYLDL